MKKSIIVFLVLFVCLSVSLYTQEARVFLVNLHHDYVDFRLGDEDDHIIEHTFTAPYSSTAFFSLKRVGTYRLYYKLSADKEWHLWEDRNGNAYYCPVDYYDIYCITLDYDLEPNYYVVSESFTDSPKVSFLNATRVELARMQIAEVWDTGNVMFVEDIYPDTITDFMDVDVGPGGLFWQYREEVSFDQYHYYPGRSGYEPYLFEFERDQYYLFVVYTVGFDAYAGLFTIGRK